MNLRGLTAKPAQVWGAVRLVPLIRDTPIEGLRLDRKMYDVEPDWVAVDPRTAYTSYIPHGFVARWGADGVGPAYGTQLFDAKKDWLPDRAKLRRPSGKVLHRMAKRVDRERLRFLPMNFALEGYLALHFGGPTTVWEEWTDAAVRQGLSPRTEETYTGAQVTGLDDALRIFEIHPGQCGVALYVADALASVFVVPHPGDYRVLHRTLLQDLYGETLLHYALLVQGVPDFTSSLDDTRINSLADLRAAAQRQHEEWDAFHDQTMVTFTDEDYTYEHVYELGEFTLSRAMPPFVLDRDQHIGEVISTADGVPAYQKTFRLTAAQVRRGYLLKQLAAHGWSLKATAEALNSHPKALAERIERAGFRGMLRDEVVRKL